MSQFFYIHPDNLQPRLINQAVEIVRKGALSSTRPIRVMRWAVRLKIKRRWSVFAVFASCRTVTTLP